MDIARFAPVWLLYGVVGIFAIASFSVQSGYHLFSLPVMLAEMPGVLTGTNMWLAALAAFLLFGDLCKGRICNGLHAMPLRRETWFGTHFVAGLAYSFLPNTVFAIILAVIAGANWFLPFLVLICMSMQYLFFFGVACFSIHCTGRNSAAAAVFLAINFFAFVVLWFLESFYLPLLPGVEINEALFAFFCPLFYCPATPAFDFQSNLTMPGAKEAVDFLFLGLGDGFWYMLGMGAVGIAFALLALALYRKRHLETASDFISARGVKPVFLVVYTLCIAAMTQLLFVGSLLILPLGLALGYFTGLMLLRRKVHVFQKRSFAGYGAILGVLALTLLLTGLDPLGRTQWVPKEESVASVGISPSYFYEPEEDWHYSECLTVTDPQLQKKVLALHQAIIDQGLEKELLAAPDLFYDYENTVSVYLTYRMEDGSTLYRYYLLERDSDAAALADELFSLPEYVMGYENWDAYLEEVTEVVLNDITLRGKKARGLLEAMKADCQLGRMTGRQYDTAEPEVYVDIYRGDDSSYLCIYKDCTNTIRWLNENAPGWRDVKMTSTTAPTAG